MNFNTDGSRIIDPPAITLAPIDPAIRDDIDEIAIELDTLRNTLDAIKTRQTRVHLNVPTKCGNYRQLANDVQALIDGLVEDIDGLEVYSGVMES